MKTISFTLLSASALAWSLAGCASSSDGGHALETNSRLIVDLPMPEGEGTSPALFEWSVSTPVEGMGQSQVLKTLGHPGLRLTPDLWIYWRYYSPEKAAEMGGHDTLVVAFAHGKVSGMKLVNSEVLQKHLAGRRYRTAQNQL